MPVLTSTTAVEGPKRLRYSNKNGNETVRTFKGGETEIRSKAQSLLLHGYDIQLEEGPVWTLEASIAQVVDGETPQPEVPVYTWELSSNPIEKDLLQADIAAVNNLALADLKLLRDIFDGKIDNEDYTTSSPAFTSPSSGDPVGLWLLWSAGLKSIKIAQPVLRRSYTVSREYQIPASLTGVNQVWSTARVISAENVPSAIAANLQASAYVTKAGESNQFYYGWLKGFPQVQLSNNKAQISQEWEWGLWPSDPVLYTINS